MSAHFRGWSVVALKPAQGFEFTTIYESTSFDPRRMWFLPLESESHPGDLGIRVAVPELNRIELADYIAWRKKRLDSSPV